MGIEALYDLIDMTPGPALDDPSYNANGMNDTQRPGCPVLNLSDQTPLRYWADGVEIADARRIPETSIQWGVEAPTAEQAEATALRLAEVVAAAR